MTSSAPEPASDPAREPRTVQMQVRAAPRIWAFIVTGVVLGAVAALVVTWISHASLVEESKDGSTEFSFASAFGFMLMIFGVLGAGLGGVVFLIVDRIGRARLRTVEAVVEPVPEDVEDDRPDPAPDAAPRAERGPDDVEE